MFLANKVDELGLSYVLIIDGGDGKIAATVIENTDDKSREILALDSMQSITKKDAEEGKTYLGIMKSNLQVLKKALG